MGQLVYILILAIALAPVIWGWLVYSRLNSLLHQLDFARLAYQNSPPERQPTARNGYAECVAEYDRLRGSITGRVIAKIFGIGPAPKL